MFASSSECLPFYPAICFQRKRLPWRGQEPRYCWAPEIDYMSERNERRLGLSGNCKTLPIRGLNQKKKKMELPGFRGGGSSTCFPRLATPPSTRLEGELPRSPCVKFCSRGQWTGGAVVPGSTTGGKELGRGDKGPHLLRTQGVGMAGHSGTWLD